MDAEDLVVDGRSEGERVEDIAESLPHLHLDEFKLSQNGSDVLRQASEEKSLSLSGRLGGSLAT